MASRALPGSDLRRALVAATRAYKWFHRHPELSGDEAGTAAHLAEELGERGLEVHRGLGGHGVVGLLRGARPGPVVLVRSDMDALPVHERTGLPYASRHPGVMHACGHDLHMAAALGAMSLLAGQRRQLAGTVMFVGQPAEEAGTGARAVLADRRFRRLLADAGQPRLALSLHDAAELPAGRVALCAGFANANVDSVDIVVHGRGGHGARPHHCTDPIVIASEIVLSLQAVVSRRVETGERAVITVGAFRAGATHNVIPDHAELLLTVRSYSDTTRRHLLAEIARVAAHVARAHAAPRRPRVTVSDDRIVAAYNDPAWTARLRRRFSQLLGAGQVVEHGPSLGGEDFGEFSRRLEVPAVMWKLGAGPRGSAAGRPRSEQPGLHSSRFAPVLRPALETGILTFTEAVSEALKPA